MCVMKLSVYLNRVAEFFVIYSTYTVKYSTGHASIQFAQWKQSMLQ